MVNKRPLTGKGGVSPGYVHEVIEKIGMGREVFRTTRHDGGRGRRDMRKAPLRSTSPGLSGLIRITRSGYEVPNVWGKWRDVGHLGPTFLFST